MANVNHVQQRVAPASKAAGTVLVVDDEALVRWSLREALVAAGYSVIEAADGATALAHLRSDADRISVVLLDLRLPDTFGFSLLSAIGQACPGASIVVMTAYAGPETSDAALLLGACQVVEKPFRLDVMVRLVEGILGDRVGLSSPDHSRHSS
jgi:DNA-binding NtrC family response regulator